MSAGQTVFSQPVSQAMVSCSRTRLADNNTRSQVSRSLGWLAAGVAMAALLAPGLPAMAEMPSPEKQADELFSRLIKAEDAGLAVLVAQNGKILFEKGYGLEDMEHRAPVTMETKFRIGSVTKQFTSAAILKLQEEGKLSVNDKLSKYIPDFPRGDEVTLHHLLTHTSGIHSFTSKPDFILKVTNTVTTEDIIKYFKNDPYDFDPGAKWLYDNSGYVLLGYIVEKVSGKTYAAFLRENFFQPLGMTNTGVHRSGVALSHEALGYSYKDGKFDRAMNWDMSWAGGAGALYSTVEDLYRWNEAVFNGKVLSEESLKAAFTPVKTKENLGDDLVGGYGYGWFVSKWRGLREISHGGGLHGFSSFLLRLPSENFTVVVLANSAPAAHEVVPDTLAHDLVRFYLGDKLAPRPEVNKDVSPKAFEPVVGRYGFGGQILTVSKEGDHLFAQFGGEPNLEIFPTSETDFFWKEVEAQITFVKDKSGKIAKAVLHKNGENINFSRLEDLVEATVDPAVYDSVVGKYDYGQGKAILTVTREGNRLFAQLTGQPKFEIFPKSATEFFWKVVDAQITFVKDEKGKVTKAIHHQGGQTIEVPKLD
jgi:CubicO group peptidase (beta-lactamase class C family)